MPEPRDLTHHLKQEFQDQQHEVAGLETGRQSRFGVGLARKLELKEEKAREQAFQDALDRLLQDAEYRALYEELGNRLSEAEMKADQMITMLEKALIDLDESIADMETNAAKGPDGAPVFRTSDGRVVDTNGKALPPEIAEGIIWPPNAPTAEDYFAAKTHRGELTNSLEEWQGYRNDTLGGIRDRHEDRDNPQTIEGLERDLDAIETARPEILSLETTAPKDVLANMPAAEAFPKIGN